MRKWQELALSAALGAAIPIVGGIFWLGKLDNRIGQLEDQVRRLSSPDPVRQQCAQLAEALTREPIQPTGRDDPDYVETYRTKIKSAMDALACFRTN